MPEPLELEGLIRKPSIPIQEPYPGPFDEISFVDESLIQNIRGVRLKMNDLNISAILRDSGKTGGVPGNFQRIRNFS